MRGHARDIDGREREKLSIKILGDRSLRAEGSGYVSMRGAGIKQVMKTVKSWTHRIL